MISDEGSKRGRRRGEGVTIVLAKAAVLVMSASLCVLMAEAAIRLALPQQLISIRSDIWQPDDGLGWVVRPSIDTTINTGERTVRVRTDRDGFRVGEAGRLDGQCEILILGDSFMQALQVEHEQSLAGLIETRLPGRIGGTSVAVRNAGVDDWEPSQYLLREREQFESDPPDAVIVSVYLGNDLIRSIARYVPPRAPSAGHALRLPRSLRWQESVDAILYPINDWLEVRSHLFILVKTRLRGLLIRLGLSADYVPIGVRRDEANDPMWNTTAEVIREMSDTARAHDRPILVILIPPPFAIDDAVFEQIRSGYSLSPEELDAGQPERRLRQLLDAAGVPVVSMVEVFRREHERGIPLYGTVDRHLSPAGHEVVFEAILDELDRLTASCRLDS